MRTGFFIILLLISFKSCYYTDSESHVVWVDPPFTPQALISSNLDGLDSIPVADSLLFIYSIEIDSGQLFLADVYLGNVRLFGSDEISDSIWIYKDYVSFEGDYELTLIAYYESLSGTLADIIDAEFLASDTSWTLTFKE